MSHKITTTWMGRSIETLADLLPPNIRALSIGINPAPSSVAAGHYYQGRMGQQFYRRLEEAGVVSYSQGGWQDDQAFDQGIGFTDLVKRPTARATDVSREELAHGRKFLVEKVTLTQPELLIFAFKKSAQVLFGPFEGNGMVDGLNLEGVPSFVMPGPYAAREVVSAALEDLRAFLGTMKEL